MHDGHRFRALLRNRLLRIAAFSAVGVLADGCGPLKGTRNECFDPNATDGGVVGGGGGASGSGGAGGNAGAANEITCPGPDEAMNRFELGAYCKVLSIDGPPFVENGECCYPVTEECPSTGRPFLVEGRARIAARGGADTDSWRAPLTPRVDTLSADVREALAEAWLRDALAEHASIASFARASLELMALGAPASLIEAAHRAALDETRHAQLCFALASAYAGRELGPGAFDFGGSVAIATDLATLAEHVVIEGCVGETLAAIQAAERLAREPDPTVRRVLAEIAEDEARHAELAWSTVAWALRVGGAEVRAAVKAAFDAPVASAPGFDDVVLPAKRLLLGEDATAAGRRWIRG